MVCIFQPDHSPLENTWEVLFLSFTFSIRKIEEKRSYGYDEGFIREFLTFLRFDLATISTLHNSSKLTVQ